jgi:hypothetical protein
MAIVFDDQKLERFIPVTYVELVQTLEKQNLINPIKLQKIATDLRKHFHETFHDNLLKTKAHYHHFNPDRDTVTLVKLDETALKNEEENFLAKMQTILNNANYEQLSHEELEDAINETSPYGVDVSIDLDAFDEIMIFFRGSAVKTEAIKRLKTLYLKKESVSVDVFRRLFILFKSHDEPDKIYLKLFKDIPKSDLEMLFPNTKVKIALFDKIKLMITGGGGTVGGIMTLLSKMAVALDPVALISAIGAFAGIIWRQIASVFNHRTKYMAQLAKNLYFYNLDNNAGVISYLNDLAEDEEAKEALLAYTFLLHEKEPISQEVLDQKIEMFMEETFGVPMDFEVDDAVEKLILLNLVQKDGDQLVIKPN